MKKIFVFILLFFLLGSLFFYGIAIKANDIANKKMMENNILINRIDSLKQEILCRDIDLGRYEYMIEEIEDTNPKAAQAINEILSQTE